MTTATVKAEKATGLKRQIETNDEYVVGALIRLLSFQTEDEKSTHQTRWENSLGFNAVDAPILTDIARWYQKRGFITEKQIVFVRKKLLKYVTQLEKTGGCGPLPNNIPSAKTKKATEKIARLSKADDSLMIITFPYNPELVAKVKTVSGRRWDSENKWWTAPLSIEAVEQLKSFGIPLEPRISRWYNNITSEAELAGVEIPGLKHQLFPFQQKGVSFIESRSGRALIGDEMGLGKTVQALGYLQLHPELTPACIVVPASLKTNWAREIQKWMSDTAVLTLSGRPSKDGNEMMDRMSFSGETTPKRLIIVVNYDILINETEKYKDERDGKMKTREIRKTGWGDIIAGAGIKALVLDECHYIKNSKALRTKAVKRMADGVESVIALSGTPIINRPVEMFNAISVVNSAIFPSFWKFAHRYCGAYNNGFGWDFTGATHTDELHNKLSRTIMLRRLKADVLKDLPEKIRTVIPVPYNRGEYQEALERFEEYVAEGSFSPAEALTRIEALKQAAVGAKMGSVLSWITDFLETDQKLVIFAEHQKVIEQIRDAFKDVAVTIYGATAQSKRQEAVDRFQNDPTCRLFIGSRAAIEGLTLTAASSTCFVELWWTPGQHDQAEDRVHRIGQAADSVNAYYLLAEDTIEEDIAQLLDRKRGVLSEVLDGAEVEETSLILELLEEYRTKMEEKK